MNAMSICRNIFGSFLLTVALTVCLYAAPEPVSETNILTQAQWKLEMDSFEQVWSTLRDYHFDATFGGIDWQAVHDELQPRMEAAITRKQTYSILEDLTQRLKQSHIIVLPRESRIAENSGAAEISGEAGMTVGPINGRALVIKVEPGTTADRSGIQAGWELLKIGEYDVCQEFDKLSKSLKALNHRDLILASELKKALHGKIGASVWVQFDNGSGRKISSSLLLSEPKGVVFKLGDSSSIPVWIETKTLPGNIGYIAFNAFLDPARLMPVFNNAMMGFITNKSKGLVLDLRGNSGGLGFMAAGMAGWFFRQPTNLGTLVLRTNQLKFAVAPRSKIFQGHVAVLLDPLSLCASETLALGLREQIGARIVGSHTAGIAQCGQIVTLPNGDQFIYAVADFVSSKGYRLEGCGVDPDTKLEPTQESLLAGRDIVLESAIDWIKQRHAQ